MIIQYNRPKKPTLASGSWGDAAGWLRSADRDGDDPGSAFNSWGFGFWRAGHEFLGSPLSLFPDALHPASSSTEKKKSKARPNLANGVRPE